MAQTPDGPPDREAQRRAAIRTATVLAVIAVAIYVWAIVGRV